MREKDDFVCCCLNALQGVRESAQSIPRDWHQLGDCPEHDGADGHDGKPNQTSKPPERTA